MTSSKKSYYHQFTPIYLIFSDIVKLQHRNFRIKGMLQRRRSFHIVRKTLAQDSAVERFSSSESVTFPRSNTVRKHRLHLKASSRLVSPYVVLSCQPRSQCMSLWP